MVVGRIGLILERPPVRLGLSEPRVSSDPVVGCEFDWLYVAAMHK